MGWMDGWRMHMHMHDVMAAFILGYLCVHMYMCVYVYVYTLT